MNNLENGPRLENLYKQLLEMANGNFSKQIERTSNMDDIEALTTLVNIITERIRESIIGLGHTRAFYSYMAVTQMLYLLDGSFQIIETNEGSGRLLQYGRNDLLGANFKNLLSADSQKTWAGAIKGIGRGTEREKLVRLSFHTKHGLLYPAHCKVIHFLEGQYLNGKIIVASIDISIQKKVLEDDLQKKVYGRLRKSTLKPGYIKKYKTSLLPSDLENLRFAREYIKNHIDGPLPLKELAHKIGTNEFKLKMGFRELYGMTAFQFIRDLRLRRAHVLTLYTDENIGSIAKLVGYKQRNHLSREFKKRYGHTPRGLRKLSARSETESLTVSLKDNPL